MQPITIILCGASVRAAACSALRAGYGVWCADVFRDADLLTVCPDARCVEDYPHGLPALLEHHAPPGPFVFTGSLDNHPDILVQVGQQRPVWGMTPEVLCEVRRPKKLQAVLAEGGFPSLAVSLVPPAPDPSAGKTWLRKPLASGGGRNITFADGTVPTDAQAWYWQEYRPGEPYSALYMGHGHGAELIGLCQQLVGQPWLHAAPFAYCGNLGPVPLTDRERTALQSMGNHLAAGFGLRGLFGIDLVRDGESFFVTEVNPRYTASVELYELALGVALLADHIRTVSGGAGPRRLAHHQGFVPPRYCLGKAVFYTPRDLTIPEGLFPPSKPHDLWRLPPYADVPRPGTLVQAGQPVLTLCATGHDAAACRSGLENAAILLDFRFRRL